MEEISRKAAKYDVLKLTIDCHLITYRDLLSDYERGLKEYLKDDLPMSLIDFQNTLISKVKAKISALEELEKL